MISSLLNIPPSLGWFSGHGCKLPRSTCISSFNPIFQQILQAPINLIQHTVERPLFLSNTLDEKRHVFLRLCLISGHSRVPCCSCVQWLLDEGSKEGPEGRRGRGRRAKKRKERGEAREGRKEGSYRASLNQWISVFPTSIFLVLSLADL